MLQRLPIRVPLSLKHCQPHFPTAKKLTVKLYQLLSDKQTGKKFQLYFYNFAYAQIECKRPAQRASCMKTATDSNFVIIICKNITRIQPPHKSLLQSSLTFTATKNHTKFTSSSPCVAAAKNVE